MKLKDVMKYIKFHPYVTIGKYPFNFTLDVTPFIKFAMKKIKEKKEAIVVKDQSIDKKV